jgi:uncharacterized RDD family membrane protein YckC
LSSVVTGEAVVLELRPASFAARTVAALIDAVAVVAAAILAFLAFAALPPVADQAAGTVLALVLVLVLLVGLPVTVETLSRGRSLGKLVMGLRVVRDDGGAIRFRHALIRGLVGFLELYLMLGSVAVAAALMNSRSKRLGDMVAGTYALRERVPAPPPLVLQVPPALRAWASLADIGRIPDPLARRVLQFLRQAGRMSPSSRDRLAALLAAEAAVFVAPPPPPSTPADVFLAALCAERRNRELLRLREQRRRSEDVAQRLYTLPFARNRGRR